jgi:hypothetical protein
MACAVTARLVFGLPFVGKAMYFEAATQPAGQSVVWSGDIGLDPQVTDGGRKLRTSWPTAGTKTLTATCQTSQDTLSVTISPISPSLPAAPQDRRLPEPVPQKTFILEPRDPFTQPAFNFHKEWGLSPLWVPAMVDIVARLSRVQGAIRRVRLVTHATGVAMRLAMFRGGETDLTAEVLRAFNAGAHDALRMFFGSPLLGSAHPGVLQVLIAALRQSPGQVLAPFGLQTGGNPTKKLLVWFDLQVDQLALSTIPGADAALLTRIANLLIPHFQKEARLEAGVSNPRMTALANTVAAVNIALPPAPNLQLSPFRRSTLHGAEAAFNDGFSNALERMRDRITPSTVIDIRGCQAGTSPDYLDAVASFFGGPDNLPQVTAPDRFTSFPIPTAHFVNQSNVGQFAARPEVRSALSHWAQLVGVTLNPALTDAKNLMLYLDLNWALPVLIPFDSTTNSEPVPEILCLDSSKKARQDWLEHQWTPPIVRAVNRLASKWKSGQPGPQMIELSKSLQPSPTQQRAVCPDTNFARHIKQLRP